jgi:hypothetical protein
MSFLGTSADLGHEEDRLDPVNTGHRERVDVGHREHGRMQVPPVSA